jgi:hypothetical protein
LGRQSWPTAFPLGVLPLRGSCLGIHPNICPPRRPDKNASVERLHRTLNQECLRIHLPTTLSKVREVTGTFLTHYNRERPQEANRLRESPAGGSLPALASTANVARTGQPGSLAGDDPWAGVCPASVGADGSVDVDDEHYYIKQALAGQQIVLFVNAPEKVFDVWLAGRMIKSLPIKGLVGQEMAWEDYVSLMKQQARSEERHVLDKQHRMRQLSFGI